MPVANARTYLADLVEQMKKHWPENRAVHIVCHGHSVPAGYFATPMVDTFNAYPHLLHRGLKDRFPFAVINVIVTAIGGENASSGADRFERDVLCHRPDVITIDYGLNDRGIGLEKAEASWRAMIEKALDRQIKLILLTPTQDVSGLADPSAERWRQLLQHADQIRALAAEYRVGLADSLTAFESHVRASGDLTDLLSWSNHPNRRGHEIVATEMLRWFAIT
jgi:lysophospholipase L1-like esterase